MVLHAKYYYIHKVMTTSGKSFDIRKGKAGHNIKKATDEKRHVKHSRLENTCLWSKRNFLTCTVDEGHAFRNINGAYYSVLELMKASLVRMISTATPLYTSPKACPIPDLNSCTLVLIRTDTGFMQHRPSSSNPVFPWP